MSSENLTFQRCPHDKENPYTMISRALIRDQTISPECRWLIIYLLSNKEGWKVHLREVINHCKGQMGRDRVYAVVKEAMEAGYIMRHEYASDKNLRRVGYYVSESPKFKKSLPHPENQDAENQSPENQDYKEEASSKDHQGEEPSISPKQASEEKPEAEKAKASKAVVEKRKWGAYVEMTEKEFQSLISVYGYDTVLDIFESINDHITNNRNGKGYKDYIAAFRTFYKNQSKRNPGWKNKPQSPHSSINSNAKRSDNDSQAPNLVTVGSVMETLGMS